MTTFVVLTFIILGLLYWLPLHDPAGFAASPTVVLILLAVGAAVMLVRGRRHNEH